MKFKLLSVIMVLAFLMTAGTAFGDEVTANTCKTYLKAMNIPFTGQGNSIQFKTGFPDAKTYDMICVADGKNKFVYLAVLDLYKLPAASPAVCKITKQMAVLNYGMILTKLEWDEKGGEVRLSISLSTEDGLSQKAFVAALSTLMTAAEHVEKSLK